MRRVVIHFYFWRKMGNAFMTIDTGFAALLCFVINFHAVFNIFVNQSGAVFWIGSAIPLTMVLAYLVFLRGRVDLA